MSHQTVRVIPRERGPKGSYTDGAAVLWDGAIVIPQASAERLDNGQQVTSTWSLYGPLPCDAVPRPQDAIEVDGLELDTVRMHVVGRMQTRTDLHGVPHHVEGVLTMWEG